MSGLLLAEAAIVLARREQAQVIVIGQNLLARGRDAYELVTDGPCPIAIAPYGHGFVRGSVLARIALACTGDDVSATLSDAHTPVLLVPGAGAALV